MATTASVQDTDFTHDVLGRYICNAFDEARQSANRAARPDARDFDVIVIGGGSFGPVFAQHLYAADRTRSYRILVLEAGRFLLSGHVQDLPLTGLGAPGPVTADPGTFRAEVWGLPWRSNVPGGFPGLAYCLGGRSVFFGGWSPRLLASELPAPWPPAVTAALNGSAGSPGYFDQASEQIGTSVTNDFIWGPLHEALRSQLKAAIDGGSVSDAIPLAQLPLHLPDAPAAKRELFKLEAPLAVQGRPARSGSFDVGKFSSVPLLMQASRAAQDEYGDDVKKRLMVVPDCHVTRLITDGSTVPRRVVAVDTNLGQIPVPEGGAVILALGTIESARLALISFPGIPNIGSNLVGHLRSNLTIRIPRSAIGSLNPTVRELQASALFVKGRHDHADHAFGHFHLQITAAGLAQPSTNSEAELFKAIPDFDTIESFRHITDSQVVLTIRGIGEMRPRNPASSVGLALENDEYQLPRAWVTMEPGTADIELWQAMDAASDQVAHAFAAGGSFEVLANDDRTWIPATSATDLRAILPYQPKAQGGRRDGRGTTHHEAGTLAMGDAPATSVVNADSRFHAVSNAYAVGPAVFPTVGSPNPMLTGVALARRLADHLASLRPPFTPDPGFTALFDGTSLAGWRMSTIRNQPGRDNPGRFILVDGALEAIPGNDIGLLWHTTPTPADYTLMLEYRCWRPDDNSGVFVRFPHPDSKGYDNTAFVGVNFGFEVQIDDAAAPDAAAIHKTGAIYGFAGPANPASLPVNPLGAWNRLEIRVNAQAYTVLLNGTQVTSFAFAAGSDAAHPDRGLPSTAAAPRFVGIQTHTGRVTFRRIQIQAT